MGDRIGFIGQGFIGKHMADDFEHRGYRVVRYSMEEPYINNKDQLQACSIIFVAVPTPTTPEGFDLSIVESALTAAPDGATVVIKSTIIPGSTVKLQQAFPKLFVMHAPEFLREKTAAEDTAHPERNILGIPKDNEVYRTKAAAVMATLPFAPYTLITSSETAECIKYVGNTFLFTKVVFMNLAHDFAASAGADWEKVREAVTKDSRIGNSHNDPIHASGRGAGGHCFIKDFEAFIGFFKDVGADSTSIALLEALRHKNNELLVMSKKDLELLRGVYGDQIAPQADSTS